MTVKHNPSPHLRKRRTRAHVIADLSVNHVERHVLRCGFAVEIMRHDYGIDMMLFFYEPTGEVRDGQVLIQLKATDEISVVKKKAAVAFKVDRRDLDSWLGVSQPVILVVYDAQDDKAYWLYVQALFEAGGKAIGVKATGTVTVHLPMKNVLDEAAILKFQGYNDAVERQLHGVVHHHD